MLLPKSIGFRTDTKYLFFAPALSYKAGLDRNDFELLDVIHQKTQQKFNEIIRNHNNKSIETLDIETSLIEFNEEIEKEVRAKNTPDAKDKTHDANYLSYDDNDQSIKDETDSEDVSELLTLNSDIIRNTRDLEKVKKQNYIHGNVSAYILLMWQFAESFKDLISGLDKDKLKDALINKSKNAKNIDIDILLKKAREMIMQIIPISIIQYMSDHLASPKLKRSIVEIIKVETNTDKKMFLSLLLLKVDFVSAMTAIGDIIEKSKSYLIDQIIFLYLLYFCYRTKLDDGRLNKIIALLEEIRAKYSTHNKTILPYLVKDTFASDVKKSVIKKVEKNL